LECVCVSVYREDEEYETVRQGGRDTETLMHRRGAENARPENGGPENARLKTEMQDQNFMIKMHD